jgi:hypothetical protein
MLAGRHTSNRSNEVAKLSGALILPMTLFGAGVVLIAAGWVPLAAGSLPAPASALQIAGTAGYLSEWELRAVVTAATSGDRELFSGPLSLEHTGLCSANGPEKKSGKIEFYISKASSSPEIHAMLFINGARCSYSGTLSGSPGGFMDCSDGSGIPLTLLVK